MPAVQPSRVAGLIALALVTVTGSAFTQPAGRHPDRRYVDNEIAPSWQIQIAGPRSVPSVTLDGRSLLAIGLEAGPDEQVFGDIAGVLPLDKGLIAIVDRMAQDVRVFDSTGRFVQRIGRSGQGPGEFRAPHTIASVGRATFAVVDMQRRMAVFALLGSTDHRLVRQVQVVPGVRSLCRLGDQLVASAVAPGDPAIGRVLDSTGAVVRSFGKIYVSPSPLINAQMSEGRVACDTTLGQVVFASNASLGELRAYRPDGRIVWRTRVEGTRSNAITETSNGGYGVEASPSGAHELISLNVVMGCPIIVQYVFRTKSQLAARERGGDIITLVVDPKSGAPAVSSSSWPRIAALTRGRAYVVVEDPAPRVEVRRLTCGRPAGRPQ